MLRFLVKSAALALCLAFFGAIACATPLKRPNQEKEIYAPPWNQEMIDLAISCENLNESECAMLRQIAAMPHAYWMGIDPSEDQELHQGLHDILLDAKREGRVPTIVIYAFPNRGCGGSKRHGKRFTAVQYRSWMDRVSNAIRHYNMPMNIIVEPGGLAEVLTNRTELCGKRTKSEVLKERIGLLQYVSWVLKVKLRGKDKKMHRVNPNLRLFIDVGYPSLMSAPWAKMMMADALEKILMQADVDGVSVNVGKYDSFDDSVAMAKKIIAMVRLKAGRKLTTAVDIGRSGYRVDGNCNARGAALDLQLSTLMHPDRQIEIATIIKAPGESDGDGPGCHDGGPMGSFDMDLLKDYLRNSTALYNAIPGH